MKKSEKRGERAGGGGGVEEEGGVVGWAALWGGAVGGWGSAGLSLSDVLNRED